MLSVRVCGMCFMNLFDSAVIGAATDAMPSDCVVVRQNYGHWDLLSPVNQQFYYVVRSQCDRLSSTEDSVHDCKMLTNWKTKKKNTKILLRMVRKCVFGQRISICIQIPYQRLLIIRNWCLRCRMTKPHIFNWYTTFSFNKTRCRLTPSHCNWNEKQHQYTSILSPILSLSILQSLCTHTWHRQFANNKNSLMLLLRMHVCTLLHDMGISGEL